MSNLDCQRKYDRYVLTALVSLVPGPGLAMRLSRSLDIAKAATHWRRQVARPEDEPVDRLRDC